MVLAMRCRPGPLTYFSGFSCSMNSSLFALEVAMARPRSNLALISVPNHSDLYACPQRQ